MAVGFYRSTWWGRYLTRATAIFLAIVGPGVVLNPFLYGDVRHAQLMAGKPLTSTAEFVLYLILYEIVFFVGIYLIDRSDDGVRRKWW